MNGSIMLVAGSVDALTEMENAISGMGIGVALAKGAEQAKEVAENGTFAAIVLDMPSLGECGPLLCKSWREDGTHTISAILALTTPDTDARRAAIEAGADELLTRPLDPVELQARLSARYSNGVTGAVDLLAHDLKSPMGTVISALELLSEREHGADGGFGRLLDGALAAAKRQLSLIDDILDLARMRKGTFRIALTSVDVSEAIATVAGDMFHLLRRKGLKLEIDVPDALPPALADPSLLDRVLRSLFDNILKFTVRGDRVAIEAGTQNDRVFLSIRDTGRAIQAKYLGRIFDTDIQWEARQAGSRTSVALGLPFCLAAMRAMRGRITVGYDPKRGENTFVLTLLSSNTRR